MEAEKCIWLFAINCIKANLDKFLAILLNCESEGSHCLNVNGCFFVITEIITETDHYGIRGNIHKWISSFLNNRNQKVVIDGYFSDTIYVDWGMKFNAKKCYIISNDKGGTLCHQ